MNLFRLRPIFLFVVAFGATALLQTARGGAQRQPPNPPGLEIAEARHFDTSRPLRDTPPIPPGGGTQHEHPVGPLPVPRATGQQADPVRQQTVTTLAPATVGAFEGIGQTNYSVDAAPPDTNGTVGPNHYVQWVNEAFAIFDKQTGAIVYGPAAGNTLWSGFGGGCQTNNDGDPIILYDRTAGRWLFSQFSVSSTPYQQCIAVSQTSDPTGPYYRYSFSYSAFNDYPKFGIWPDAYYATFNMFTSSFIGAKVCAFDRARMLQGLSATQQCFNTSASQGGLLPSDLDGTIAPPAGSPNYVLNFGANSLNVWKFHVDWSTPANSTFTGPTNIAVAAFVPACNGGACIPQTGTNEKLDSLADRLMYRLAYRNFGDHEAWVVNHSVALSSQSKGNPGGSGVRWYELRRTGGNVSVYQQGTFAPDSTYRWMGSAAMDQAGDIAIGYSVSSATLRPGIRYTGRAPGDPLGTLQTEATALSGNGSQTPPLDRWGDYSSMSVDPTDDCTFWYTNQYLKNTGNWNWSTWIASFKFPACGGSPTPPLAPTGLNATAGNASVGLAWNASAGATSYNVLRSTTDGGPYGNVATGVNSASYTDNTVVNDTTYYYVVQAANSAGTSGNSDQASATPTCAAPAAPTSLSAAGGDRRVTLSWTASAGATSYNVKRSTADGGPYTTVATGVPTTGYSDTDPALTNGTTYYYVVSAVNACTEGANSPQASATPAVATIPPAPTGLTAQPGPTIGTIALAWNASAGATSYKVKRSLTSGGPYTTVATGLTSTSYVNSGLKGSGTTRYYYVVTAVNSVGESGNSNEASSVPR
jgi:fibronectin type 3 domain-containing protein